MDVMIITPEPGRHKEIGQRLLALADSPRDVQWVTWPSAGFAIPVELFARFDADSELELATGGLVKNTPVIGEGGPAPLETPRRRGRPRKEETSTDNNTSEEE